MKIEDVYILILAIGTNDLMFKYNITFDIAEKGLNNLIKIAKEKVQRAKESLEITRKAYLSDENTKVGYLELQNSRKNYNMAKLEYIARIKFYNNSLADLQKNIFMYDVNSVLENKKKKL